MSDESVPQPDQLEGAPHPRETATLIGQQSSEAKFLEAYNSGRLHHAWLISGPKGVGKATLAWRIARFMLSQITNDGGGGLFGEPSPPDSLDIAQEDPVFRRVIALAEPNLFLCRRPWDEKAGRLKTVISVEEVRKLKSFFTLSAAEGGWRIAIVDAADEMNTQAANALLKILEEPPEKCLILLVCHQPARLLPTIRSRCRELRCEQLLPMHIAEILGNLDIDAEQDADVLAEIASGSAGEAVELISQDGIAAYTDLLQLINSAPRMNRPGILALGDRCSGRGNEAFYNLTLKLLQLALSRLALAGVRGANSPIVLERELAVRLSSDPAQAQLWAACVEETAKRTTHARAVNLDPGQVILDTMLAIDETASAASRLRG